MEEDMNLGEQLRDLAEENQTRKILEILNTCETLEEAKEKVGGTCHRLHPIRT